MSFKPIVPTGRSSKEKLRPIRPASVAAATSSAGPVPIAPMPSSGGRARPIPIQTASSSSLWQDATTSGISTAPTGNTTAGSTPRNRKLVPLLPPANKETGYTPVLIKERLAGEPFDTHLGEQTPAESAVAPSREQSISLEIDDLQEVFLSGLRNFAYHVDVSGGIRLSWPSFKQSIPKHVLYLDTGISVSAVRRAQSVLDKLRTYGEQRWVAHPSGVELTGSEGLPGVRVNPVALFNSSLRTIVPSWYHGFVDECGIDFQFENAGAPGLALLKLGNENTGGVEIPVAVSADGTIWWIGEQSFGRTVVRKIAFSDALAKALLDGDVERVAELVLHLADAAIRGYGPDDLRTGLLTEYNSKSVTNRYPPNPSEFFYKTYDYYGYFFSNIELKNLGSSTIKISSIRVFLNSITILHLRPTQPFVLGPNASLALGDRIRNYRRAFAYRRRENRNNDVLNYAADHIGHAFVPFMPGRWESLRSGPLTVWRSTPRPWASGICRVDAWKSESFG
ncbi:MAG: hypothetical protein M5R36_28455 [Deltaproteobacteria bacterium]|nr:hypothetical protein [Deltaproteobacteria bacterium]